MAKNINNKALRKYLLVAGDIAILVFSLWLTLAIRYGAFFNFKLWQSHFLPFVFVMIAILILFYIEDLYEIRTGQRRFELINKLLISIVVAGAVSVIFFYLSANRLFNIRPQRVLLIYLTTTGILTYLWHKSFYLLAKSPKITNNLLLIGYNKLAEEIIKEINSKPELGYRLSAIVSARNQIYEIPDNLRSFAVETENFDNLKSLCTEKGIDNIISTIHPRQNPSLLKNLFSCLPLKITFAEVTSFYEEITGKVPVNTIEQIWFLENLSEHKKRFYDFSKRLLEVIFSLILLIIALPFIPLIALIIKISSPGPIFFVQTRLGKEGKKFEAIKFRTMVKDAETSGPQWATKNDPRVTRVGNFLRKTRIDEIPQLLNVLRSEMSLIGPRPERPEFIEQLQSQIPFYKERLLVKPGLTGWAQVMGPAYGGSTDESLEKLQYDLYYIKNRSLGLDLSIILKTIRTVLSRQGQ